ncbi:zinc ribbon domain-containing protein [Paenibacillus taichungensis]|uniref:zinc ribbon domain-containing protein n=1 Tax=Paenibacillus taichungensis TaxID=484184 RepID=UPI002870B79E|nr:zinc ribbon domain-containing protein [Paenibacillus taichungensis]MDR9748594.1 zinc ribbon domain-containing protein [Paenibacillus taichungensis]
MPPGANRSGNSPIKLPGMDENLRIADPFEPPHQRCHVWGTLHPEVKILSVLEWTCVSCGIHHDRDENAAHNIKQTTI